MTDDELARAKAFAWELGACNGFAKLGRTLEQILADNPYTEKRRRTVKDSFGEGTITHEQAREAVQKVKRLGRDMTDSTDGPG